MPRRLTRRANATRRRPAKLPRVGRRAADIAAVEALIRDLSASDVKQLRRYLEHIAATPAGSVVSLLVKPAPLSSHDATSSDQLLRERFESVRMRLLREGLTTTEAAARLGMTVDGLRKKAMRGELLALKLGRDFRFPAWQFASDTPDGIIAGVRDVLAVTALAPIELAAWFEAETPALDNRTPVDALRSGHARDVVSAARGAGVT